MFNTPVEIHRRYDLKGSWAGELIVDGASQPVLLENSLGGKVEKVDNEHFGWVELAIVQSRISQARCLQFQS